jgi:hypothetical protein
MTKALALAALCVALVACQPGTRDRDYAYSVVKEKHAHSTLCGSRPGLSGVMIKHYTSKGNYAGREIQCVPQDVAAKYRVGDKYP